MTGGSRRETGRPGEALRSLADLALPVHCAGCGRAATRWCEACAATVADAVGFAWSPTPAPAGMPPVWAAAPYDGPLRAAVVAWKDEGRRDLTPVLTELLAAALAAAAAEGGGVLGDAVASGAGAVLVPTPSARGAVRRRGDRPVALLVAGLLTPAVRDAGLHAADVLALRRRVLDQAGLSAPARAANLEGAMTVPQRRAGLVVGRCVVVVDDVVTSGATLAEAARALRRAGSGPVLAVTAAATSRRDPRSSPRVSPPGGAD